MGGGGSFIPWQDHWRWFSDDNAEPVVGDALAAEDTEPTLANNDDNIRLRVRIDEKGGKSGNNQPLTLEYNRGAGWVALGSANEWDYADGQATEGNNVTTLLLTGTNDNGEYHESGTNQDTYTSNSEMEVDVCVVPTGTVQGSTRYEFRVLLDAVVVPLVLFRSHPAVTTAVAAADELVAQCRSIARRIASRLFGRVN